MSVRPSVWQRLPDIAPNYGKQGRNRKMLTGLRPSRESEVITRDNVCQANQLSQRLSTIQIERSRTMRLLNTGRQTFLAKQTVKQRNLERAGITEVSLLTPRMLLQATTAGDEASIRRQQLRRKSQLTNTVEDFDDDDDDVFEEESAVCSLQRRRGSDDVEGRPEVTSNGASVAQNAPNADRWNRRNVGLRFVSSAVGAATTTTLMEENSRRDGGVQTSDVAKMYRSRTMPAVPLNAASSFMTHNFSKAGHEIIHEDDYSNSSTLDPAAAPTDVINDRRFQSLVQSLSPCTRCDSFIQLSPSGFQVTETYSSAPCDMERLQRAIAANGGTARLRYTREKLRGRQAATRRKNAIVLERSPFGAGAVGQLSPIAGKQPPFFGTSTNRFPLRTTIVTAE